MTISTGTTGTVSLHHEFRHRFAALTAIALVAYTLTYVGHPWVPGGAMSADGWFSSWDQMMYRRAAQALTELDFGPDRNYYPPLFPWLGAPFVRFIPSHTYFVPGFLCLAVYLYGFARLGERYFGRALTYGVLLVMFAAFPLITRDQWVIPWTSSGVAALSSVLFVLYDRFERRNMIVLACFYLAYGAVFATRPADVLPFFPLALAFAWRALVPIVSMRRTMTVCAVIGAAGLIFPAIYLALNWIAFGDPLGGYIRISRTIGFIIGPQLAERAVSLWIDSVGLYGDPGQSLGDYFPLFVPALVLCCISLWRTPALVRLIAIAVLLNLAMYVGYAEITPENLLRYNVVHYFKWAMPWLVLIAAGEVATFVRERAWWPLAAAVTVSLLLSSVRLTTTAVAAAEARFVGDTVALTDPKPMRLDIIDVIGVDGGFQDFDSAHKITVDGVFYRGASAVRAIRMPWGTRFFFPQSATGRVFSVTFPPPFTQRAQVEVRPSVTRLILLVGAP